MLCDNLRMIKAFAQFWNLCIFRGETASVPASNNVIATLVVLLAIFVFIQSQFEETGAGLHYFASALIVSGCVIGGIFLALRLREVADRFRKTLSAYVGTLVIMDALLLLAVGLSLGNLPTFVATLFAFWRFGVVGWILKQAWELSWLVGVLIAFFLFFVSTLLVLSIFPAYLQPTT